MWDLIRDTSIQAGILANPKRPSFNSDVRPIFERLSNLQWVNAGFAAAFGWKGPFNFATPEWLSRLSKATVHDRELRRTIANQFRVYNRDSSAHQTWPWQYGDAVALPASSSPRENLSLSGTQLNMLQQWASGDFDEDYDPTDPVRDLEQLAESEQPAMLDRAALEFCVADAFHPGCEMTWPMRTASMYMAPFRIKHAPPGSIEPDYGASLAPGSDALKIPGGPLNAQWPGGITRWMALPWQTDTASCRSGYEKTYDSYLPAFWPARVPNQVLTEEDYRIVMDEKRPLELRLQAFARRAAWIRPLGSKSYTDQINNMIHCFGRMGVVEHRQGPTDGHFPVSMQVETLPAETETHLAKINESPHAADQIDLSGINKMQRFPNGLVRRDER